LPSRPSRHPSQSNRPKAAPGPIEKLSRIFAYTLLVAVVLAVFVVYSFQPDRSSSSSTSSVPEDDPRTDPYNPDCRIIRAWLKRHYGSKVNVVSWGNRTTTRNVHLGDHVTLSVSFRVGAGGTKTGFFVIGGWNTVESATISD
jgi:hypothetical protein